MSDSALKRSPITLPVVQKNMSISYANPSTKFLIREQIVNLKKLK